MDCEWLERVSRLIDGELDDEEAAKVGAHLLACPTCREARNDFLLLGKAMREVPSGVDPFAARRAEHAMARVPFWPRPVPVPAAAFVGLTSGADPGPRRPGHRPRGLPPGAGPGLDLGFGEPGPGRTRVDPCRQAGGATVRLLGLGFALLLGGAADAPGRIELKVTTIRETGTGQTVLSEALVDGPPGTDFTIDFRVERFVLHAGFTTYVVGDQLGVEAALDTKRLYGVGAEPAALRGGRTAALPAGRIRRSDAAAPLCAGREGDRLKDRDYAVPGTRRARRPAANPLHQTGPERAHRHHGPQDPHRFRCEARLVENGREIGRGGEECRLDAARELSVADLVVRVTVDGGMRDGFSLHLDVDRSGAPVARHWAGAGTFGEELTYDLGDGRELKLGVRPVE